MLREVTLEEYFTLNRYDREEFKEQVCQNLWQWEPSVRTNIEEVLKLGMHKKYKDGSEAASGLLAHVKSLELIQALRRHFKDSHKDEEHFKAICILFDAIFECPYMTFEQRLETVTYYIANPRYPRSESVDKKLRTCLSHLKLDLLDWDWDLQVLQDKLDAAK